MDVLIGLPGGIAGLARVSGFLFGLYVLLLWGATVLWVYRDIARRSEDRTTQMVALLLPIIFPLVGIGIYLVLRPGETLTEAYDRRLEQDALLAELHTVHACPSCRRPVEDDFVLCAYCGTTLKQACGQCGRALLLTWRNCPYCGLSRGPARQAERRAAPDDDDSGRGGREAALEAIRRAARATTDAPTAAPRRRATGRVDDDAPAPTPRVRRQRIDDDEDDQ